MKEDHTPGGSDELMDFASGVFPTRTCFSSIPFVRVYYLPRDNSTRLSRVIRKYSGEGFFSLSVFSCRMKKSVL